MSERSTRNKCVSFESINWVDVLYVCFVYRIEINKHKSVYIYIYIKFSKSIGHSFWPELAHWLKEFNRIEQIRINRKMTNKYNSVEDVCIETYIYTYIYFRNDSFSKWCIESYTPWKSFAEQISRTLSRYRHDFHHIIPATIPLSYTETGIANIFSFCSICCASLHYNFPQCIYIWNDIMTKNIHAKWVKSSD